jgi:group I intron endonuclease
MNIGIYALRNIINGKRYIGSSSYLHDRFLEHRRGLRKGIHFNPYLQKAWNKYGEQNFVDEIIECCETSILLDREEFWIKELKSHTSENGYNMCKTPRASRLGCKASPETIARMKFSLSGEKHPMWGKHLKKETVQKLKDLQTGVSKPTSGKRKTFVVISPTGEKIEFTGLRKFCREHNINHSMLWRVLSGKQKEYNGWRLVI